MAATRPPRARRSGPRLVGAVAAAVIAAGAALAVAVSFVVGGTRDGDASIVVESAYPLVKGEVQNFLLSPRPQAAPEIAFVRGDGEAASLAEYRGRWVLLNLWATWCGPCRREMPALDRLESELGGKDFHVLPLSQDRTGIESVVAFYEENGLESLGIYVDSSGRSQFAFGISGLPATVLLDPEGRAVGRLIGPAAWDGPDALALLRHFLSGSADEERP